MNTFSTGPVVAAQLVMLIQAGTLIVLGNSHSYFHDALLLLLALSAAMIILLFFLAFFLSLDKNFRNYILNDPGKFMAAFIRIHL